MSFKRTFMYPRNVDVGLKAAKVLGLTVAGPLVAVGGWRSLKPVGDDYADFFGPFTVTRGVGPVFIRDDGTEVFMLDDTSGIEVTFTVEGE